MCFLHNFRDFFVKLLSPGRVCNFIRSVRQLCNNVNGMRSARVHIRAVNIYSAAGEAFFFFFFFSHDKHKDNEMVFTLDPQLPVPSGASRTHTKKQKFICLLFPAPIDETVSASNHSVLSFNLFFFLSLFSTEYIQPPGRLRAVSSNILRNKHRCPHFSGLSQLFCVFKRFCLTKHVLIVIFAKQMPKRVSQ